MITEKVIRFGPITIQRYRNGSYGFNYFFIGFARSRFIVKRTYGASGKYLDLSYELWPIRAV